MLTRRQFILSATALAGGAAALQACAFGEGSQRYADAVKMTWQPPQARPGEGPSRLREMVRCATLAPSSHNTQCWRFRIERSAIAILPDLSRRCPVVDPNDHHLFVSLGCAAENLILAAQAYGLKGEARHDDTGEGAISIVLDPTRPVATPLF